MICLSLDNDHQSAASKYTQKDRVNSRLLLQFCGIRVILSKKAVPVICPNPYNLFDFS
jgi:hypothetical protein